MDAYELRREEGDDNGLVVENGAVLLRGVTITEGEYEQDRAVGEDLHAASNAGFNPNPVPDDVAQMNVWADEDGTPQARRLV